MTDKQDLLFNENDTIDRLCHVYSERNAEERDATEFWKAKLSLYCIVNGKFTFRLSELMEAFTVQGIYPTSLVKSLTILRRTDSVVKNKRLITAVPEDLTLLLVSAAFTWAKSLLQIGDVQEEDLACMQVINDAEVALQKYVKTLRDCDCTSLLHSQHAGDSKFAFPHFVNTAGQWLRGLTGAVNILETLSSDDALLLANHMLMHKRAVLSEDRSVIKVLKPHPTSSSSSGSSSSTKGAPAVLHEGDTAVLRLRVSIWQLEQRVAQLDEKADSHRRNALRYKVRTQNSLFCIVWWLNAMLPMPFTSLPTTRTWPSSS